MPVTKDQAHMLAALAVACRPYGAPTWDAPGVVAAIAKVGNLALPDVAMACIRAATDPTAKSPAVISATNSQHWREKTQQVSPRNVPARHRCNDCGQAEDAPIHRDDHEFEQHRTAPAGATTTRVDQLRAIHQEATR